jgi:hypothetical protein
MPPGPPAPVPPEVAMAHPTQEEIDKMNADLRQFIANSPDRQLLQRYESLITVQTPRDNSAIRPTGRAGGQHDSFVKGIIYFPNPRSERKDDNEALEGVIKSG